MKRQAIKIMTPDTRNMIAAASLSMLVLVMWQLYFVEPELLPKFEQILIRYASNLNTDKYPPC